MQFKFQSDEDPGYFNPFFPGFSAKEFLLSLKPGDMIEIALLPLTEDSGFRHIRAVVLSESITSSTNLEECFFNKILVDGFAQPVTLSCSARLESDDSKDSFYFFDDTTNLSEWRTVIGAEVLSRFNDALG